MVFSDATFCMSMGSKVLVVLVLTVVVVVVVVAVFGCDCDCDGGDGDDDEDEGVLVVDVSIFFVCDVGGDCGCFCSTFLFFGDCDVLFAGPVFGLKTPTFPLLSPPCPIGLVVLYIPPAATPAAVRRESSNHCLRDTVVADDFLLLSLCVSGGPDLSSVILPVKVVWMISSNCGDLSSTACGDKLSTWSSFGIIS